MARIYRFARMIVSVDALRRRFPAERGFPPDSGPMPAD
jgi:hypothetical protein